MTTNVAGCNVVNNTKSLNPNDPKDGEINSKMFEKLDEEEKDEDFELYVSDNKETYECVPSGGLVNERHDVTTAV